MHGIPAIQQIVNLLYHLHNPYNTAQKQNKNSSYQKISPYPTGQARGFPAQGRLPHIHSPPTSFSQQ